MNIYSLTIVLAYFAELFVLERLMRVFFDTRRTTQKVMLLIYFLYFAAGVTQHFLLLDAENAIQFGVEVLVNVLGYFAIASNYKAPILKRIGVTIIAYPLMMLIGSLSTYVIETIWPSLRSDYDLFVSVISIASVIMSFIFVLFLLRFKNIRQSTGFFPSVLLIPSIILLALGGLWLLGLSNVLESSLVDTITGFFILALLITVSFLGLYIYNKLSKIYEEKLKMALSAQEREYYLAQCQLMQKSVDQVKSIRHDMKSHLATVRGYSIDNKPSEVTTYVDSLLGDIGASEVYCDTGNIAFDSILNFKLQNAGEENVKVDLHVMIPNTLHMDVADIATILGNLIDNALFAVTKTTDRWIKIDMEYNKKCLYIQVENTFDGQIIYENEESQVIKSSKTGDQAGEHGYGLKNIKNAVDKYNGQMDVKTDGNVFSVTILLYGV